MITNLKAGERLDDLQLKGYQIIQDPEKFCFGMDAVLLSAFTHVKQGERVLDLGTGTGILPVLLAAKTPGRQFVGLEIQEECADMARRSVVHNGLSDQIEIVTGDIKEAASIFGSVSFDIITTNPPYMAHSHGLTNPEQAKAVARHEIRCNLEDVIRESALVLKPKGRFYMVHRPFRLTEIFAHMNRYGIEPKRMQLVHPYLDKEPNLVLIEGMRGGGRRLIVEKPLIVYQENGEYTLKLQEIYGRGGQ